jgi:uncharacterized protein (UPF0332 family)
MHYGFGAVTSYTSQMPEVDDILLEKAVAALAGAESEFAAGRYDNVANRCYYACIQAVIAAREAASIRPTGGAKVRWTHPGFQAQFVGILINRRKRYPSRLREVLSEVSAARQTADYTRKRVSESEAKQVLRRNQELVAAIRGG